MLQKNSKLYLTLLLIFAYFFFIELCFALDLNEYYIKSIKLENGNIMLKTNSSIYLYNSDFTKLFKKKEIYIPNGCKNLEYCSLTKNDGEYILLFTSRKNLYIITTELEILFNKENYTLSYSSIIPYGHSNHESYFFCIYYKFLNESQYLIFEKYSFNPLLPSINIIQNNSIILSNSRYSYYYDYLSCQLINRLNKNTMSCFIKTQYETKYYINYTIFDPENNFNIIDYRVNPIDDSYIGSLRTITINEKIQKIIYVIFNWEYYYYIIYNNNTELINIGKISFPTTNKFLKNYGIRYYSHYIEYFKENEECLLYCFLGGSRQYDII